MTPDDEERNRELRERMRGMLQHFPSTAHAQQAFTASRNKMLRVARRQSDTAEVLNWGPACLRHDLYEPSHAGVVTGLGDDYWSAILKVDTDELRDRLSGDQSFMDELWEAARGGGFAPWAIQVESSETVLRHYRGNWGLRWKA